LYKSPLEAGVRVVIVDVLCNWYSKLRYAVRWNGELSAQFTVCSGVSRGAAYHLLYSIFYEHVYWTTKVSI